MELSDLSKGLLDALEKFDEDILPLGLYSSDELVEAKARKPRYQEWSRAIFPYLAEQGCSVTYLSPQSFTRSESLVVLPETGDLLLTMVKFSNIKVREYGSGYYVDKHEHRAERWKQADLSEHISNLWRQRALSSELNARILIFTGFDKSQRPFERELSDLQLSLSWETKQVSYATRTWHDKAKRGFNIRLAVWSRVL